MTKVGEGELNRLHFIQEALERIIEQVEGRKDEIASPLRDWLSLN